jgi:predicted DNA binding CopG/RHH family protein
MVKNFKLEAEERELLNSYERGEWQSMSALPEKLMQYQTHATAALEAEGLVSIILSKEDLKAVQQKATEAGVSYQTLIANIVHQFVSGHLMEKSRA